MILSVENLAKSYRQDSLKIDVLSDIRFSVQQGESLALVGPSGSGKTTLLTLLAGLDLPDRGQILFDQADLCQMNEKERTLFRGKNIGIVFQQFHLMPHLTALENVCLPLEIFSIPGAVEKAKNLLNSVGLSHRENHFPSQLSGGECQRVAIARAAIIEPPVLLADEPSGSLDLKTGQKVMDLLFQMCDKSKMSLILVTHDPELAQRCDRQVHLMGGRQQ